jgi:hypothetical protein
VRDFEMNPVDLFIFQLYKCIKVETNISQIKYIKSGEDLNCIVGHQAGDDFLF